MNIRFEILEKIKVIMQILGVNFSKVETISNIEDMYFDTASNYLLETKRSARIRKVDGKYSVVIKTEDEHASGTAMARMEREKPAVSFAAASSALKDLLKDENITQETRPILIVTNQRTLYPFSIGGGEYTLCCDKYFYRNSEYKSETFYGVEVESKTASLNVPILYNMQRLFTGVFGFEPTTVSKYEYGRRFWTPSEVKIKNRQLILIDVESYSKKTSESQKNVVIALNDMIRRALKFLNVQIRRDSDHVIAIPIGDGAILAFDGETIQLGFVDRFVSLLNDYNKTNPEKRFSIRIAMHYGQSFEYQDINESKKYAGDGINMVNRVASKTPAGQVWISEEYYKWLCNWNVNRKKFSKAKSIKVKHGVKLTIRKYNIKMK
jgi:uncharacterized protein YjbK